MFELIQKNMVFVILFFSALLIAQDSNELISFRYGFIGQEADNPDSLFIVEDGSVLNSGDELKLNFEFGKGTFSYVAHLSSKEEYALLYSSSSQEETEKTDAIFTTLGWQSLDDVTGDEVFFLLSSGDRLQKLEDLFGKYNQAKGKSRRKFSKRIASELENLEKIDETKKSSQLVQRLEKPVMGGVTFRGGPVGLVMEQNLTHRSEGEKRTVAVFRIQHK